MRIKIGLFCLMLITLSAAGCNNIVKPAKSGKLSAFETAQIKWKTLGATDYTIEQRINCWCLFNGADYIVRVENRKIVEVKRKSDGQIMPEDQLTLFKTVDQLFELIVANPEDKVALIRVEYDKDYGFPKSIYIDYNEIKADEEMGYETGKLEVAR